MIKLTNEAFYGSQGMVDRIASIISQNVHKFLINSYIPTLENWLQSDDDRGYNAAQILEAFGEPKYKKDIYKIYLGRSFLFDDKQRKNAFQYYKDHTDQLDPETLIIIANRYVSDDEVSKAIALDIFNNLNKDQMSHLLGPLYKTMVKHGDDQSKDLWKSYVCKTHHDDAIDVTEINYHIDYDEYVYIMCPFRKYR